MVAGTDASLLIIPVHDPHAAPVGRLRIENLPPLHRPVMYGSAGVGAADFPVVRHRYLVEELRARPLPQDFPEIPQEKAIDRHDPFRQEPIVLNHHRRIGEPCQPEGSMQVLTVCSVIVKEQYGVLHFSMPLHFSSTSLVR